MGDIKDIVDVDIEVATKVVREAVINPEKLDKTTVVDIFNYSLKRLDRVRMGGRSTPLLAVCTLLWHRNSDLEFNETEIEKLLCTGFQVAGDPSYVHPEAGIILVGTILAKYLDKLSEGSKEELVKQVRLMLQYIEKNAHYQNTVNSSAEYLLEEWSLEFTNGFNEIVRYMQIAWPSRNL